ncbi:hypothetical protein [Pectinatus frisingensis]|uniref:hypothetical protein n=1 Tax=Pectinatus frisingensis TaxID=865 RepID=UPI0018C6F944|nr:hypothetical protein [Pectinatus frisingensis]
MLTMTEAALYNGTIYGDNINAEYIYIPASEIGMETPLCIFEKNGERLDVSVGKALDIVRKLSLKPVVHPRLGDSSC